MALKETLGPTGWKVTTAFVAGLLIGGMSVVEVVPKAKLAADSGIALPGSEDLGEIPVDESGNAIAETGGKKGSKSTGGAVSTTALPGDVDDVPTVLPPTKPGLACAPGKNGGATDQGVTATEIKMATTVVDSGIGAAFLRDVRFAMDAVKDKVNRAGGICGRKLVIEYRDDGWRADTGAQFLRNFIQQGVFAIPVCPSSEGCNVVIKSGDLDKSKTPMVGTDGQVISQYQTARGKAQPWVWPVATATVASARIMVKDAYRRGARKASDFSIVFDKNYRFGFEGAAAFNAEVRRLTGDDVRGYDPQNNCDESYCGINAGKSSYSTEVATFEEGNFVALFLEPQTALAWMGDPNTPAAKTIKYGYGAAQPLFTRDFAQNCRDKCDQMAMWTGFKPPIENYKNDPAVQTWVNDLKRTKPDADEYNAFAEGGYVGMQLAVEALKRVGPELTRQRYKVVLDSLSLRSGLTFQSKLRFTPASRFANITMQAFIVQHKGTFGGWRAGPMVQDPRPQAGIG